MRALGWAGAECGEYGGHTHMGAPVLSGSLGAWHSHTCGIATEVPWLGAGQWVAVAAGVLSSNEMLGNAYFK